MRLAVMLTYGASPVKHRECDMAVGTGAAVGGVSRIRDYAQGVLC